MRIVIDLQAAQSLASGNRGIGRYSLALAQAMVRHRGEHEVLIALNGMFADSVEPIRLAFEGLLPQENIRVWEALAPVAYVGDGRGGCEWRRKAAEALREHFLESLEPDLVHVSSLFEGFVDDAVTSVSASCRFPVVVTLYDLIPYIHQKEYLENPSFRTWYLDKIEDLRRADLWLAISDSSRREGVEYLALPDVSTVNISTDADKNFRRVEIAADVEYGLRTKYGLHKPFVMYTGGIDRRKNVEGLIRAYSRLPAGLRASHQLAIVCSVNAASRDTLQGLAAESGLARDELVLTGFVSDQDLIALYNLCALFIFPSWHEGFGLPALEAMRCGAPVIAANTSSLPEVIGWDEALFDPYSDDAITRAVQRALTDKAYRGELVARGIVQARRFSWDESALRAIDAMEHVRANWHAAVGAKRCDSKHLLAFVSPLPPDRSGIADYSVELLPSLARHYDIEVISDLPEIENPWVRANCPVRSVKWFLEHALRYDRVIYHFGNSAFHQHMFGLLRAVPGVVVLHDFYLSGVLAHMQWSTPGASDFTDALLGAHGFPAIQAYARTEDKSEIIWEYPCSLGVVQDALGVIVHSPHSRRLAKKWYALAAEDWAVIPLLRNSKIRYSRTEARTALGIGSADFLVCAFGLLGPHKLNHRLVQAWARSELAQSENCHLIFVGQNDGGAYGEELLAAIKKLRDRSIRITGWVDEDAFRRYLAAADVGVQLRTLSRGETSAAVLDCMNHGVATIVNANGSMADLQQNSVLMLPDEFTDDELSAALDELWRNAAERARLAKAGRETILRFHDPDSCADAYARAIEGVYRGSHASPQSAVRVVAGLERAGTDESDIEGIARAVAVSFPRADFKKQLFVDISELVSRDSKSGIQRVVRSLLRALLTNPPPGVSVEPVYADLEEQGYRYARNFTFEFLGCPEIPSRDCRVDFSPGDIFLGLDLQPAIIPFQEGFLRRLRNFGVKVQFVVYDLLPVRMPQCFLPGAAEGFTRWLNVVSQSDGAICISEAVAQDLSRWLAESVDKQGRRFSINSFHLGADIENSSPSFGVPENSSVVLQELKHSSSFIMVGTLEPRKAHEQVLDAFELLWARGGDAKLVIVGKVGWMVESLVHRLDAHPQLGEKLFWLKGISDEYLERIYRAATCLIAASEGEGFGLPLIEAAQHQLPIIARDIPVFREVAGEHAFYFSGKEPQALANAICSWLDLFEHAKHPKPDGLPWLTWEQSASKLLECLSLETGA